MQGPISVNLGRAPSAISSFQISHCGDCELR